MEDFTVKSWYGQSMEGKFYSGKNDGAFHKNKHIEFKELWVIYKGKKYKAPGKGPQAKLSFKVKKILEFNIINPTKHSVKSEYILIADFPERKITKYIDQNGKTKLEEN